MESSIEFCCAYFPKIGLVRLWVGFHVTRQRVERITADKKTSIAILQATLRCDWKFNRNKSIENWIEIACNELLAANCANNVPNATWMDWRAQNTQNTCKYSPRDANGIIGQYWNGSIRCARYKAHRAMHTHPGEIVAYRQFVRSRVRCVHWVLCRVHVRISTARARVWKTCVAFCCCCYHCIFDTQIKSCFMFNQCMAYARSHTILHMPQLHSTAQ